MKKLFCIIGALTTLGYPASGQETKESKLEIKSDNQDVRAAGPAEASRESDEFRPMNSFENTGNLNGNSNPIPYPDIGSGGGNGKVKNPGNKFPGGPIGGDVDPGIAGIGGSKQLTTGGGFKISIGAPNVFAEGKNVARAIDLMPLKEKEDEKEEESQD